MKKFTIIISHYNQIKYIDIAIKSVLSQSYKNIELIIADDCSKEFSKKYVENLITKNNKNNFDYIIYHGKKNVGTVKNLNNALKLATGDYILFFAADDKLYDKNVVSNFIKEFENSKKNIVTSQCLLYGKKLKESFGKYVNAKKALKLNKKSSNAIYEKMCEGCFYGSGGTAYRKEVFKKYGLFNEKYKFVEDFSYWLYILREGEKIYYADFNTLCHRDGGISHSEYTSETLPAHVKQYYKDILNIYEKEVIPYLDRFKIKEQYKILKQFNETILYYASFVPELLKYQKIFDDARLSNKKLKYYWKLKTLRKIFKIDLIKKIKILIKYNRVVPITYVMWIIFCLIVINNIKFNNYNILLLAYVLTYLIIYCIVYVIDKFIYYFTKFIHRKLRRK